MLSIQRINLIFLIVFSVTAFTGTKFVWNQHYHQLLIEHQSQLDRFAGHITSKLDKYAHIPKLLSKDSELIDALHRPNNAAQIEITNRYLEQVNNAIEAADSYLLDKEGTTISASNWNSELTFIGNNFSWRPYYQQAIQGEGSQYFALGSTSGERGYYYSYPVIYAAEVIGVIVVKMDLTAIEENWNSQQSYFVATDINNIIFMSNNPQWLFKSLSTLTTEQKNEIRNSRQYLDNTIYSLGLIGDLTSTQSELRDPYQGWLKGDFVVSSRQLELLPLTIRIMSPKVEIFWSAFGFFAILCLIFTIFYLIALLVYSRKQKHRQLEIIQSKAKQKLEYLVLERTANLHAEVRERKLTEMRLRQTQDELIQAAKLAVLGQMSASISHELNNPLAAIRSFADNGRRFLEKQNYQRVYENFERISSLTERMAKISQQLKSFARKSDQHDVTVTNIDLVIQSSVDLMAAQLKSNRVEYHAALVQPAPMVEVNTIQLEQVLINLLSNAIQAMDGQTNKRIVISTQVVKDSLIITVNDSGPGIPADKMSRLFEPFFTTKKNGLGLGLSISQQIVLAMSGNLTVSRSKLGGACFSLSLPITTQE
ncbi:sensor histidine kinase [Thaumasiovibrio sp. DFM-14]|uniref:sensor histidine kinase n=1 Tax=Thaumasiovibrio sp. DFM-14 TaxID=3384792 RepID=UPI0039A09EA1